MKKITLFAFLAIFALQSVAFAAVGGSKKGTSSPPPPPQKSTSSSSAAPTSPPPAPKTAPDYKPSAPATQLDQKAPGAKPNAPAAPQQSTGSNLLRNIGMFGGGMLAGSMLSNMFGFGQGVNGGMAAGIFGLLFNVLMLAGIFMGGRFLWNKYKASKKPPAPPNFRH